MVQEEPYAKISPTAKLVAYGRTFTDIPFAREIAAECDAEKAFQTLSVAESLPLQAPFWEARYKITNRIIAREGMTQILEIAAGLSPRGLAMTDDPDVVYVATDLSEVLVQEKAIAGTILARLNIQRPNLYFSVANALDRDEVLQAATPFQSDKPVVVLTEGLFTYLTRAEQAALAANVHELLARFGGVWITPDVSTKQNWDTFRRIDKRMQQRVQAVSSATERSLYDNLFNDKNDVQQFFTSAGFKIEEYSYLHVLGELSSLKHLNFDRERIVQTVQGFTVFILTL
jgi:O-methyltransferase involved in polyketide biosynthesis